MLCGNNGEACWAKYGSYPLHKPFCHEQALRIVLACIQAHANRYKRHIVPVSAQFHAPRLHAFGTVSTLDTAVARGVARGWRMLKRV